MDRISISTYAKINLSLDVTGKRADGYHNIDSIFEEISLCDTVTIELNNSKAISLSCSKPGIPTDSKNIAWKAADEFFEAAGISNPGMHIHIDKNIPNEAGMGGGSSNAAGVIKLLNEYFNTKMTDDKMIEIAAKTGADTPFFIKGKLCHVEGLGEIVNPLPDLPTHYIVCAKGNKGVSTPEAYRQIDLLKEIIHHNTEKITTCIEKSDLNGLMPFCINTFELTDIPDDIENIKSILNKYNPLKAMMTGSGAAVFGIFNDFESADKACAELSEQFAFAGTFINIR